MYAVIYIYARMYACIGPTCMHVYMHVAYVSLYMHVAYVSLYMHVCIYEYRPVYTCTRFPIVTVWLRPCTISNECFNSFFTIAARFDRRHVILTPRDEM